MLIPNSAAECFSMASEAFNLAEQFQTLVFVCLLYTSSGGALAIAVADRVLMMENSIYSVISPEGCAAIMWRDATKKELAAEAMRITATDLSELGCIDDIVPEPEGGCLLYTSRCV